MVEEASRRKNATMYVSRVSIGTKRLFNLITVVNTTACETILTDSSSG